MNEAVDAACEAMSEVCGDWIFGGPTRRWPDPAPEAPTRCPYFTGTPPRWDDIEGDWLVQDGDGEFKSYPCRPEPQEDLPWWRDNGSVLQVGDVLGKGPHNPNWKHAIEPRPETHK